MLDYVTLIKKLREQKVSAHLPIYSFFIFYIIVRFWVRMRARVRVWLRFRVGIRARIVIFLFLPVYM